jgi:hypothetical protein
MDQKKMTHQEAYEKRLRRMRHLSKYSDTDLHKVIEEGRERLYSRVFRDIGGYSREANEYIFERWTEHCNNDIRSRDSYKRLYSAGMALGPQLTDGVQRANRDMFINDLMSKIYDRYEAIEDDMFLGFIMKLAFYDIAAQIYDEH